MNGWQLPTEVELDGQRFAIRSDYRAVLDAIAALNDPELTGVEKSAACLQILYPEWDKLPNAPAALTAAMVFINCGRPLPQNQPPKPLLVDWEKDAEIIAPAVDKVLGTSCRRCNYLHWWEFVGAYTNIGRGLFAQVVAIRAKRAKGKRLEPYEKEFMRENPALFGAGAPLRDEEEEFFKRLGV